MRLTTYGDDVPFPSMASGEYVRSGSCGRYNVIQKQMLPGRTRATTSAVVSCCKLTAEQHDGNSTERPRERGVTRKSARERGADTNRQRAVADG